MAANTLLHGPYGWYYPYTNEKGKNAGIKLFDEEYEKYYKKGYLTDNHLEDIVNGKTITFTAPTKNGKGTITISAKLIPYTTKAGRNCKIIEFTTDQVDDLVIIRANGNKIIESYWNGTRFDYAKPQKFIDSLDLSRPHKTWATYDKFGETLFGSVKVYRQFVRNDDGITFFCKVVDNNFTVLTEEQYKIERKQAEVLKEAKDKEVSNKFKELRDLKVSLNKWLDNLINSIWTSESISKSELIKNIDTVLGNVTVPNLEDRVVGMLQSSMNSMNLSKIINNARDYIRFHINVNNYDDSSMIEEYKNNLLHTIKSYAEYLRIIEFRNKLYNDYTTQGLDLFVSSIDIDTALSLGYFNTVKKVLNKYKSESPKYIIYNMYKEVIDLTLLENHIMNMLKIYYDFYNMPEKDRKSIAKFIAVNKLSEYYDAVKQYDDVLEVLIDNSKDPKLTKPLLEGIAGTSRANVLKDKTYYFEKTGKLRGNIVLYKPVELVEELKKYIKEFNVSSNVAILTNIELNADESFNFQFYTFAEGSGNEDGFDGRRMLNLTKIYNRHHPDKKIGFVFDNSYFDEDDD